MAACRLRRADGKELARPPGSTLAADVRPSAGNARGDPSLLSAGRPRPMGPTDQGGRVLGVAGLPLPRSQTRVAELVQSGCDLGLQLYIGGRSLAFDQPGGWSALSRVMVLGLRRDGSISKSNHRDSRRALAGGRRN